MSENDKFLDCVYIVFYIFLTPAIPINLVNYCVSKEFQFLLLPALLTPIIPIYIHFKLRKIWRKKKKVMHLKAWQNEMHPIDWTERKRLLAEEQKRTSPFYGTKCSYCEEIIPRNENTCKFCGHDKQPIEVIEKRSRNISSKVKREVWRRDYGKCVECGSQERLEYDHIIPFSKGGSNTARNIQILCEKCNRKKHNKIE